MFFICPRCGSASAVLSLKHSMHCPICHHVWKSLRNELTNLYYVRLEDIRVCLSGDSLNEYQLKNFPCEIGRDSDFNLLQKNRMVSRKHCKIDFDETHHSFMVYPYNTGGGTYLNEQRLDSDQWYPIAFGDKLNLAGVSLSLSCYLEKEQSYEESEVSCKSIILPISSGLIYLERGLSGRLEVTNIVSEQSLCAFLYQPINNEWKIFSIQRNKVRLDGDVFIEHSLLSGSTLFLDGGGYVFNAAQQCLEPRSRDAMTSIRLSEVQARYGQKTILEGVSCTIPAKRLIAILGPSGCGKTTLIKILSGLKNINGGIICLLENPEEDYYLWAKKHLSLVPQHDVIHLELTVRQCLEYSALIRLGEIADASTRSALVDRVMSNCGLLSLQRQKIESLSGGERKRVNIAVEVLGSPDVLLLDEPTTGLDYETEKLILAGLKQMSRQGQTVVFVTHSLSSIKIADHVIVLGRNAVERGATVIAEGTPSEVQSKIGVESWEELYAKIDVKRKDDLCNGDSSFNTFKIPSILVLCKRYLDIWKNSWRTSITVLFGLALLLGLLIGVASPENEADRLIFAVVAMFWLGMNQSVREIVKEHDIFIQEFVNHISASVYLSSKVLFFIPITALQAFLMCIPITCLNVEGLSLEFVLNNLGCPFMKIFSMMWIAGSMGCFVGLLCSSFSLFFGQKKGEIVAVLLSVLITLPQLLFSDRVIPNNLAHVKHTEQFYHFGLWNESAPISEFLSYFTFSRYLYMPLNASITRLNNLDIYKSFLFNCSILFTLAIVIYFLTLIVLRCYCWHFKRDE